jgi:3-hydroxyacyl-[acyl-carrier-protein] dehydratase
MEGFRLDIKGIHEYQQNRYPFLMMDVVEEVVPGVSAKGYKNFTINDWFFECHFPEDPNVPGMLQIEALVQLCALTVLTLPGNKGKVCYLVSATNLKWSRKVIPGDRFDMETQLHSWKRGIGRCSGKASVNGEFTCSAEFTITMPDILSAFKVVKEEVK